MSLPKIVKTASGYYYHWEEEAIRIDVNRLHNHNDGHITGEITISTSAPGLPPHLHQAQFNFSSTYARSQLVKTLEKRYETDWYAILEQLAVYTLERVRCGEPVIELWSSETSTPPEYLLEPLIIKNYPTIIFGDRSAAKSTLAIILAQVLLLPWTDNPLGFNTPTCSVKTLYLDYETDPDTIRWQLTMLQRGMGLPPLALNYRFCAMPIAQDLEAIQHYIQDYNIEVIIIDSLGSAAGGELKEAQPALAFYYALRQLKKTSLILAHTAKEKETRHRSVYGSTFFEAYARNIWEIQKRQDAGESELDIALFHRKPPPFDGLHSPMGFNIKFENDHMLVSSQNPRNVQEFISNFGTQAQIEELLKAGAMSPKDIIETLELTRGSFDMAIKRLRDKEKVIKVGEKWGLSI